MILQFPFECSGLVAHFYGRLSRQCPRRNPGSRKRRKSSPANTFCSGMAFSVRFVACPSCLLMWSCCAVVSFEVCCRRRRIRNGRAVHDVRVSFSRSVCNENKQDLVVCVCAWQGGEGAFVRRRGDAAENHAGGRPQEGEGPRPQGLVFVICFVCLFLCC